MDANSPELSQLLAIMNRHSQFLGSGQSFEDARVVIAGAPMDWTVSFRPGSRFGPRHIRQVSDGIEPYSPYVDKSLADVPFWDAGDLDLPFGNVDKSLELVGQAAGLIYGAGKFPLFLGGEHLISLPVIKEAARIYPDLVLLHFDAHADLRETYHGEANSHATVIRMASQWARMVYQFGIRSGVNEEFEYARRHTHMFRFDVLEPLLGILPKLEGRPVYVSLDIDVVDPAFAPGTGTPEAGGCSSRELLSALRSLAGYNVVGFDLVEVAPAYDASERTSLLAAVIVREAVLMFGDHWNASHRRNC